jgi:hypothetical protein
VSVYQVRKATQSRRRPTPVGACSVSWSSPPWRTGIDVYPDYQPLIIDDGISIKVVQY